mmetsp:Transcript_121401/g.338227  ORF Transcript_121401/g.338227 Transcript_121401/m.338227 type:complete len:201 (+) Transcript_121401:336-938(+)
MTQARPRWRKRTFAVRKAALHPRSGPRTRSPSRCGAPSSICRFRRRLLWRRLAPGSARSPREGLEPIASTKLDCASPKSAPTWPERLPALCGRRSRFCRSKTHRGCASHEGPARTCRRRRVNRRHPSANGTDGVAWPLSPFATICGYKTPLFCTPGPPAPRAGSAADPRIFGIETASTLALRPAHRHSTCASNGLPPRAL